MATKAISADVKAANSKLAQFFRRREEDEMILQIGKRKAKQVREERLPGGSGRWRLEPDWKAPTPMVDRPRTIAGATSFHFSFTSIAKQAVPTVGGAPVEGSFGKVRNAALDHSKYIERDGAAEVRDGLGADHAAYIERDGAAENIDPSGLMSEAVERTIAHMINESPTPDEAELLGVQDVAPAGIPSVFSNISDDSFERQEFWRAVERSEREPRSHHIILDPEVGLRWWAELETSSEIDPVFKEHALKVAEAYRQHMAAPLADGQTRKPFEAEPYPVSAEHAGELIQQAQGMPHYNHYAPPFEFKSGRGGRIQIRFVAELPHEVSAEDRALIVQNFCDHLATLKERRHIDGTPYKTGMMYTAVIHAPDSHNDSRNYHLHIVAYDRPCRWMPEHGQWDFEVADQYNHKGEDRIRWPHRQAKIEELSRIPENGDAETMGINAIPALRAKFAEINNTVLKARGIKRQLDPRKYTEMGIDRTPTEHLGTKAAALESIGVPTAVGQLNAIAIWSDAERSIRRQAVQASKTYVTTQASYEDVSKAAEGADPTHPAMRDFRALLAERQRLIADVAEDREGIMTFDHLEAKAKSRAIRTRETCLQFLADIENGKADRSTKMMRLVIEDRWKASQQHIESIDKQLEPHREALAKAARNIEAREQRIAEIDVALEPLKAVLETRVSEIRRTTAAMSRGRPAASQKPPAASPEPAPSDGPAPADKEEPVATPDQASGQDQSVFPAAADGAVEPGPAAQDPIVEVEAPSIKGFPIVEPTIAPRADLPTTESEIQQGTPEGLEPLRPIETQEPQADAPEVVVPDFERPGSASDVEPEAEPEVASELEAGPVQEPRSPEVEMPPVASEVGGPSISDGPEPAVPAGPVEPAQEPAAEPIGPAAPGQEPKVDGRRKQTDPTLFPLPTQEPPVKPGTSKAEYADFDQLVVRIMNDRVPIHAKKLSSGKIKFVVPSLTPDEQQIIQSSRFAHRASQRLGAIHDKQQQEIQRVLRWISSQGQNPDMLHLENRSASIGEGVRQSVRTLFKHWGRQEVVLDAIRAENSRREELAKSQANEAQKPVPVVDRDIEERRREAKVIYPTADQAFTPQVAEFITLLRDAAPDDKLKEAAAKIAADPRAREDIQRHTVQLATAYQQYNPEDLPMPYRVAGRTR